jgi:hypothetical protein
MNIKNTSTKLSVPNQKQIDKMFKAIKNFQENNKNYLMI